MTTPRDEPNDDVAGDAIGGGTELEATFNRLSRRTVIATCSD